MGMIDFLGGAGAVGAQMGMEQIRSMAEEEKAARLMEMQNKFQTQRDEAQRTFARGERVASQEYQAGENQKGRDFTAGENQKGRDFSAGEAQKGRDFSASEAQKGRDFTAGENDKNRALEKQRIGIAAGQLQLAKETALRGQQVVQDDGRVAMVVVGKDGTVKTTFLKTEDGKDFYAPKNITEKAKLEFNAISERVKALDKIAAESMDEKAKENARAQILALTDRQQQILGGGKETAKAPGVKDPFASTAGGDAQFEDMKRRGAAAGPMNAGGKAAPKAEGDPDLAAAQKLEADNPELKRLGDEMRLTEGNVQARARAAYLKLADDIRRGAPKKSTPVVASGLINPS